MNIVGRVNAASGIFGTAIVGVGVAWGAPGGEVGVGVGVGVGVNVGVGVDVGPPGVGVGVGLIVRVGVVVMLTVGVGVVDGLPVGVGVTVTLGLGVIQTSLPQPLFALSHILVPDPLVTTTSVCQAQSQ